MKRIKLFGLFLVMAMLTIFSVACGNSNSNTGESNTENENTNIKGSITADGSSTVFPIMEAVSEEYSKDQPNVNVSVSTSGTGGGFKKFTIGDTDLSNASRPIKEEEAAIAKENSIDYQELKLAIDGLTVVVSKENDFVDNLTIDQLKKIFVADSGATKWSDINPEWPNETIKIYSPGHDSGTFDYFNEVILEEKPMREDGDVMLSEDDNLLVQGVISDKYAIAYFGYAYYVENEGKLKALGIDNGNGPILPNNDTVQSGEYSPLSRPLFTYVNTKNLKEKAELQDFLTYTLENAGALAEEVGYVALPQENYDEQLEALKGLIK